MYSTAEYHYKTHGSGRRKKLALCKAPFKFCKDFCLETSMHGFIHIAVSRRHWFERLLWAFVTGAAIWGALEISLGQLQRFNENPTVVTLEKDFRTWNFSLPAVTACEVNRVKPSKLPEAIQRFWNLTPEHEKYEYYSRFVATVANSDLLNLHGYQEFKDDKSLNVDLIQLVQEVIPDLLLKTTWSEDVDSSWTPVMTESGVCYTTNSLAIADVAIVPIDINTTKMYPLMCKYASMSCFVILEVGANCNVFSTNSCRLTCRSKLAVKLCGCKPFYYFYEEGELCTPAGMACLSAHADVLANNAGAKCACAQQCFDSIFKEISYEDQIWAKGPFVRRGSVRYIVQAPRTRYTREIVFHFQDLVVSFGGAAGLFLGASFISFVEIFYFIIVRILKICIIEDTVKSADNMKKKLQSVPYETRRMMELTSILERQRRFHHGRSMKLYY